MHKELVQEVKGPQGPCHETVTCEPELTSSCGAESELALLAGDIKEQPFPGRRTAASPMMPAKYEEEEGNSAWDCWWGFVVKRWCSPIEIADQSESRE